MTRPAAAGVVRNALWNVVPLGWSLLLALSTTAYFVREIGLAHFGLYGLALVLTAPLGLAGLGFSTAAVKLVAGHSAAGRVEEARRVFETVYWMAFLVGACGALLLALAGPALALRLFRVDPGDEDLLRNCVLLASLLWLLQQPSLALSAVPAAFSRYRDVALGNVGAQTLTAAAQVALVALGHGLAGLMAGTVLGAGAGWILWMRVARGAGAAAPRRPRLHRDVWGECFRFGGWQTLGQAGSLLATYAERFILGMVLAPAAVGIYNAVLRLEQSAMAAAYRLAEVLLPWFSGRADAMAGAPGVAAMLRTGWFAGAASAAMLAPLVGLASDVLGVWLGPEVASQGAPVLALMTVGGMIGAGTNTVQMFLLSRGRTAWVAALALAYGALTCLLAALLVPRFGLAAAALAGTAALLIRPPAFHWMLRELGGGPSPVAEQVSTLYLPVLVAIAVSLAAGELLPPLEGWISVAAAYAGVSAAAAVAVVAVGVVAPGGRQRRLDLKRLVAALRPERRA